MGAHDATAKIELQEKFHLIFTFSNRLSK